MSVPPTLVMSATSTTPPALAFTRKMPPFIAPQLCKSASRPPSGEDWVHEIKLDGYRMQLRVEDGHSTMRTRKGVTEEQRAADEKQLETLVAAKAATEAQIEAQLKGKVVIEANAKAVVQMTAAEKERQAILELLATKQRQNVELKELEARIQKEGINPALAAEYEQLKLNVEATNAQLLPGAKGVSKRRSNWASSRAWASAAAASS